MAVRGSAWGLNMGRIPPALLNSQQWATMKEYANEARDYVSNVQTKFVNRDHNYEQNFNIRHGLIKPRIPPSHQDIVPPNNTKQANEILTRLASILTAVFPKWIYYPDSFTQTAGTRAANLSLFNRSLWLGVQDKSGVDMIRVFVDEQLGGGAAFKVTTRLDRWARLPYKNPGESDAAYSKRVKAWKARNIPFDITVPNYNTLYYDQTVDGLVRVAEVKEASVYELAAQFGGHYDDKRKELRIPIEIENSKYEECEECEAGEDCACDRDPATKYPTVEETIVIKAARDVDYSEYWKRGEWCVYMINDVPVRVEYLDEDEELPYFLGLGEQTGSPDPGRRGLPVLYNAFEAFLRKNNLRSMEDSYLYKHAFARLIHYTADAGGVVGAEEPELPDQEQEEEVIGEILEAIQGREDWKYLVPGNVSGLFGDAKADTEREIQEVALVDVLTGRTPPSGTTGFLWGQMSTAALSKYIPILHQAGRAIRDATLYINRRIDTEFQSEVVVRTQIGEATSTPFVSYKPGDSQGNENLHIEINAPLPTDQIQRTQWLIQGNRLGYVTRERVQREGYDIDQPELENEKLDLEDFRKFYKPMATMKTLQKYGQMDQLVAAMQAGLLPPELMAVALQFAAGPDGQTPTQLPAAGITDNPNGVIRPTLGLGEPGTPDTSATANAGSGGVGINPAMMRR